jgi:two-component system sensor histidine kinase KdpD
VDEVIRGSEDIEVHVIGPGTGSTETTPPRQGPGAPPPDPAALGRAVLVVASALGLALLLRRAMSLPDLEMIFLLAVMVSATWLGRRPAILTAALGVACYDFFFVPPLYTFSVQDRRYFLTFGMMFIIGLVVSSLAARLRRQEQDAVAREEKTATLYALLRELTSASEPRTIAAISARHVRDVFGAQNIVLGATEGGELEALGSAPEGLTPGEKEGSVARWCHEHGAWAGSGTDTLPGAPVLCVPLVAGSMRIGVMAVFPATGHLVRIEERSFLDVFCRQVAAALARVRLAEEARSAALRARSEELRSTLLSAVSHDLRTPLASITGSATVLRDDPGVDERTRTELLDAVVEQAARLERLVGNLLDMTRLDSGGSPPKREWVPLDEVIGSVLARPELRMDERPVTVEIGPEVPLLHVDPVLLGQVLVNILENVNKYTPARSPVEIEARRGEAQVWIEVRDRGPGLPPGSELQVFEKFFRAAPVGGSGAGLGLAICKGMVEAHGGQISAVNRSTGGAAFRIVLPCDGSPPSIEGDPP